MGLNVKVPFERKCGRRHLSQRCVLGEGALSGRKVERAAMLTEPQQDFTNVGVAGR